MYQYPPPPQPQQQYYAYPQYPAAYPQPQPVPVAQPHHHPASAPPQPAAPQQRPAPSPAPAPAPAPVPAPAPAPVAQPQPQPQPVAPVHDNHKTNAAVATEFAEDGLDCCARVLRITLMLFVTTGFVFSALATSSCSFMVYMREPPPDSGTQTQSQVLSTEGAAPTAMRSISTPTPIMGPTTAAPTIRTQQLELDPENNNNNNSVSSNITNELARPTPAPTVTSTAENDEEDNLFVLQSVEANSSSPVDSSTVNVDYPPFSSSPNDRYEIREDGYHVRGRRVLRPSVWNREGNSFEDLIPPFILEQVANTTLQAGIGLSRYDLGWGCRRYEYKWFDSFFTTARIGAIMATGGSAAALFLLSVELICCRFFCSRLIIVCCLIGALVGQCMTFFTYGSGYCADKYTNAYNCDIGDGTIYAIVAVVMLLISAILVCPTPKSKPFIRTLVEKERQKKEIVDPYCWCFAGMCVKKPEGDEDEDDVKDPMCWCCTKQQAVADPIENSNNDPESGHEATNPAAPPQPVGAPPPPVPVYYSASPYPPQPQSQPQAFPHEVQVHGDDGTSNLSQPPVPPQSQSIPSALSGQGDVNPQQQPPQPESQHRQPPPHNVKVREDVIRSDSVSLSALPAGDDSVGGNRSVRSAYTNPEVYESDLFFDAAPSVIEEEGDEVESTEYEST